MDLNLLHCFEVVADHGSISKAANRLHLTQPAISIQIKKLEDQLGEELFDRHNRGLRLTPAGSRLLSHAKEISMRIEVMRDEMSSIRDVPEGKLKVGSYTTATSYLLPKPLAAFFKEFPKIEISYNYDSTASIIEQIKNYDLDCAILSEVPIDEDLQTEIFFETELLLVTATKNKHFPQNMTPAEISQFPFLSYPERYDLCYQRIEKKFGPHLKRCPMPIESTNFETLKQMLLEGVGLTFMPRYIIEKELQEKRLRIIGTGNLKLPIQFSFMTKKNSPMSRPVTELRQHLLSFFKF